MPNVTEAITWQDAFGVDHLVDHTTGMVALVGKRGRFMAPVEVAADAVVGSDGTRVRGVRFADREIVLPVGFTGTSHTAMRAAVHNWQPWLNPRNGPGRLQVTVSYQSGGSTVTWSTRSIACYYVGGLEGAEGEDDTTGSMLKAMLVFRAVEPFWEELPGESKSFPLSPGTESDFTAGTVRTVTNNGDVDTWPLWTITTDAYGITGPITIANSTTGKTLVYDANVATYTVLEINTAPGSRACRTRATTGPIVWTNRWGNLDAASELWPLEPGGNSVGITLAAWTSPKDFTLTAAFTRKYHGV
jgi:hypothetical protein